MIDQAILSESLREFFTSEWGRVSATVAVFLCCLLSGKIAQVFINRKQRSAPLRARRENLVWVKNTIWVIGTLAIVTIWASKIAGFALSVAAFAGAILLVSKEVLTSLMGYGLITLTRPYRVGDFVEIGHSKGRVIDIDAIFTTLAEAGEANQLTGKTLQVPNNLLLTVAVKNQSATGTYVVDLYRIVVPFDVDMELAQECALDAAERVTHDWQKAANDHFEAIEASQFLDLPSARPKVLWSSVDSKQHELTIRFACPSTSRVDTEQLLFREFWKAYRAKAGLSVTRGD